MDRRDIWPTTSILLLCLLLLPVLCTSAHGPFDNSSQLIVRDDTLELVVTMGMDGSRQFLLNAGLSESDATAALTGHGPSTKLNLSAELAPKFFEVTLAGKPLMVGSVSVITDGLEAAFTLTYPRPVAGELGLHALYFNGIEAMKPGSLIATDENRNTLGAAMLSRTKTTVEIKLPAPAPAETVVEAAKPEPPVPAAAKVLAVSETAPGTPAGVGLSSPFIWISALVLTAAVLWIAARKLTRSR